MKTILIFAFLSIHLLAKDTLSWDLGLGSGQVEGKSVRVRTIGFHSFLNDLSLLSGKFSYGFGMRGSLINANEFAIYKDDEVLEDVLLSAYNLGIYTQYQRDRYLLGFNIDILGFTMGNDSDIKGTNDSESPVDTNILLGGKNDQGTLNSEFWVGYQFNKLVLRGGLSHVVIEYEGDNPKNEKRQRFFDAFFFAVQYTF